MSRLGRYLHGRRVWWEHVRLQIAKKRGGGSGSLLQVLRMAECGFDVTYRQFYCPHKMFPVGGARWRYPFRWSLREREQEGA